MSMHTLLIVIIICTLVGATSAPQAPPGALASAIGSADATPDVVVDDADDEVVDVLDCDAQSLPAIKADRPTHSSGPKPSLGLPKPAPKLVPSSRASESKAGASKASLQWFVTNGMKEQLSSLGYTPEEVKRLEPERARAIIDRSIRRPAKGVPASWTRNNRSSRGSGPGASAAKVFRVLAQAALAAAFIIPPLYDPCIRGINRAFDCRYDRARSGMQRWISRRTAPPSRGGNGRGY